MRVLLRENVHEAAKRRIRWLFEEFNGNVTVNHSGGKDSTVIFNLALEVADELGVDRVRVCFLDSEAEWGSTIDHMRVVMHHPKVEPIWLQSPVRMYLGASTHMWFEGWDESARADWIYERDPLGITLGPEPLRFGEVLDTYSARRWPDEPLAKIIGIRAEESPGRTFGVTTHETLKGETWGAVNDRKRRHYTFSPIYDWSFGDVWKYIADRDAPYNRLYDLYWRFGYSTRTMRVADLTSGDMSRNSLVLAELEPDTYAKLQTRLGPEAIERMENRGWFPDRLPTVFATWSEYRDYLLANLIQDPEWQARMAKRFQSGLDRFDPSVHEEMIRNQVGAVLVGDFEGVKQQDFEAAHANNRLAKA